MKRLYSLLLISQIALMTVAQGTWEQQAPFAGAARHWAASFAIGDKAYLGTGAYVGTGGVSDWWEYDPATDQWTQKASHPTGMARGVGVSIGDRGFVGTGSVPFNGYQTAWREYDPSTNTWTDRAPVPGIARVHPIAFAINGKAYLAGGVAFDGATLNDVYEYDPVADQWTAKNVLPSDAFRSNAGVFVANGKAYVIAGRTAVVGALSNNTWEYDPISDSWLQKAPFPGTARRDPNGFSVAGKGYMGNGSSGGGSSTVYYDDWYMYDPMIDQWTAMSSLPGSPRSTTSTFTIGDQGYVCLGQLPSSPSSTFTNELWRYSSLSTSIATSEGANALAIYPNPSNGEVFIDLGTFVGPTSLLIHDAMGRIVHQEIVTGDVVRLSLGHLGKGVYLVDLDGRNRSRLMIQ